MARGQSYLAEIQHLLQQPPSTEVWRDLADLFSMVSGSSARRKIDWQSLLQHLLQQAPDPALWDVILNLFDAWPKNAARAQAIQTTAQQLEHWDPAMRHMSASWEPLYNGGSIAPIAVLARSLQLYRLSEVATSILKSVARSPHLSELTHLSVFRCEEIDAAAFTALARSPYLRQLRHLEIHNSDMGMSDSFPRFDFTEDVAKWRKFDPTPMRVYF